MKRSEKETLIEEVVSAQRDADLQGNLRPPPAWFDLDEDGRLEANRRAARQRRIEAALDDAGASSTVHAVLARIRGEL